MRKLRIGVIDLVSRGPTRAWFARVMYANLASIMPQVVSAWCRSEGHDVSFICYTGFEDLLKELPHDTDLVFIGAFTESAQTAYALSHLFRSRGAVTALGGPHARCYPQDAQRYFDYVFGFTDRETLRFVLQDCARHRPAGVCVSARRQPTALPGVRFDETLGAIEEAVPPNRIRFIAESSLSLLSEPHLKRLQRNGFKALLPGVESWFTLGNKSKTGSRQGMDKVRQVAEHVNLILRYVPYVQTNFVLGLDSDSGPEPFELTKRFLDLAPGAFPGYSLLTAFGQAAPLNLTYQRAGRVLPFPFHFLNNNQAMNVRPKNYSWPAFYDHVVSLLRYSFSWRALFRRFWGGGELGPRWMNLLRAVSSEGFGRLRYYRAIRQRLDRDPQFRPYFEQETTQLPRYYQDIVRQDLGPLWDWLPEGALYHAPNAYLAAEEGRARAAPASAVSALLRGARRAEPVGAGR